MSFHRSSIDMRRMPHQWQRDAEKARRTRLKAIRAEFGKLAPLGTPRQCRHVLKLWRTHRTREFVEYGRHHRIDVVKSLLWALVQARLELSNRD